MAKQRIFEYAIVHHPNVTRDEFERGVSPPSVLLQDVKRVLA